MIVSAATVCVRSLKLWTPNHSVTTLENLQCACNGAIQPRRRFPHFQCNAFCYLLKPHHPVETGQHVKISRTSKHGCEKTIVFVLRHMGQAHGQCNQRCTLEGTTEPEGCWLAGAPSTPRKRKTHEAILLARLRCTQNRTGFSTKEILAQPASRGKTCNKSFDGAKRLRSSAWFAHNLHTGNLKMTGLCCKLDYILF